MILDRWLADTLSPETNVYVKRLSVNDTLAGNSHQAGPYLPKEFLFDIFPSLNDPTADNPSVLFPLRAMTGIGDEHRTKAKAVWYNGRLRGKTRNETRLTRLGGKNSPLLDPESTGSLAIIAFHRESSELSTECESFVCTSPEEEELAENHFGPVEPGKGRVVYSDSYPGIFYDLEIPREWQVTGNWPSGTEIADHIARILPLPDENPDSRILKRREREFQLYSKLENHHYLPLIREGFDNFNDFYKLGLTVAQKRKSRAGKSLELQLKLIFQEEGLEEGRDFCYQTKTEGGHTPDFIFPNDRQYSAADITGNGLRMLAVKTTCKDRWRQILKEADKISEKHLFTLQEGVSINQFKEMNEAGVRLVVPRPHIPKFPKEVRSELTSLEGFLKVI
jgi:hypothetical protein